MKYSPLLTILVFACLVSGCSDLRPSGVQNDPPAVIPGGLFLMGCSPGDPACVANEKPSHEARLPAFSLDRTEVTNRHYLDCVAAGVCRPSLYADDAGRNGPSLPVAGVSWDDAATYCQWRGGRLPTEAEWEYAARAGTLTPTYGTLEEIAWFDGNSSGAVQSVGKKTANAWGLVDMLGNVWEWCEDWYDEAYYGDSPKEDPVNATPGWGRVVRGGGAINNGRSVRASHRWGWAPEDRHPMVGFRCAYD